MINFDKWLGVKDDGTFVSISHFGLMNWANRNEKQITVGWGHKFQHEDQRLVRGNYVEEALKAGWDDLAKLLAQHLGDCPGFHIGGDDFTGCGGGDDCPTCGKESAK